nr:NFACT RNA binding domain-containing protein [Fulvivirga aurantia]
MHGNRSNIILYNKDGQILRVFNSHLKKDFSLDISQLDRPIDQSKEAFINAEGDVKKVFPTFGKVVINFLKNNRFEQLDIDARWELIKQVLRQLEHGTYRVVEKDYSIFLSLLDDQPGEIFQSPIEAINRFFLRFISTYQLRKEKQNIESHLAKTIKQTTNYLSKTQQKLDNLGDGSGYQQLADILMANLHQIETGQHEVVLSNFYKDNEPINIKLKKNLSAQKNAEIYYRKAKNQSREIENLEDSILSKEALLEVYKKHEELISKIDDLRELRNYLKSHNLEQQQQSKQQETKPFSQREFGGYTIYIGKNAKSNDKMLQGYAYKEDLWLHAKDVSGSHVIVKHKAGQGAFPKNVIEKAAQWAAYHSKRKTDSLCPVIVTPRKYVRKRKGEPAGAVVVDKEEVIMVVPTAE